MEWPTQQLATWIRNGAVEPKLTDDGLRIGCIWLASLHGAEVTLDSDLESVWDDAWQAFHELRERHIEADDWYDYPDTEDGAVAFAATDITIILNAAVAADLIPDWMTRNGAPPFCYLFLNDMAARAIEHYEMMEGARETFAELLVMVEANAEASLN